MVKNPLEKGIEFILTIWNKIYPSFGVLPSLSSEYHELHQHHIILKCPTGIIKVSIAYIVWMPFRSQLSRGFSTKDCWSTTLLRPEGRSFQTFPLALFGRRENGESFTRLFADETNIFQPSKNRVRLLEVGWSVTLLLYSLANTSLIQICGDSSCDWRTQGRERRWHACPFNRSCPSTRKPPWADQWVTVCQG